MLEAVGRDGSISAAARATGLSYKAAWDAIDGLNALFGRALVETRSGGPRGGGAELTFERKTGNKVLLSFGSSGQFYAQITQDAPFHVFLSADQERPEKAVAEGFAVPDSRFTYAVGKLVLWSRDPKVVTGADILKQGAFSKIALANPTTAPYGAAAIDTMKALNVYDALQPKIVQGNNIAQTFQFIDTGNAELGFVALSQVVERSEGSRWLVPGNLYSPIKQDVVLLKKGASNEAAKAFLDFLKGPEAAAIEAKFGYGTPESN